MCFTRRCPCGRISPLGNVEITGLPEVAIGPSERPQAGWVAMRSPSAPQVEAKVQAKVSATLFRDFLFLVRLSARHEELSTAARQVAELLGEHQPRALGALTREVGGVRELARIDKALVKHVILRDPDQNVKPITGYLPKDWLRSFASHLNGLSRSIILSEENWIRTRAIAYAVNGNVQEFGRVTGPGQVEKELLQNKLASETQSFRGKLTPSLKVTLPNPDDPECCEYRDFSKGISELVFRDPRGGPLRGVALMEGLEKYYAVHAQASEGFGARSLRTDPGIYEHVEQWLAGDGTPDRGEEPMIAPFYRHGILAKSSSMDWLANELDLTKRFSDRNNRNYNWRKSIVSSGLSLAKEVLSTASGSDVLLIGHSQGGLVCRVAAVALMGVHCNSCGRFTNDILRWQCKHKKEDRPLRRLAVVTLATPNAGAMTFGQMSVFAGLLMRTVGEAIRLAAETSNLRDLTTPILFQEFENWKVDARYLSISGVCVNRYNRGWIRNLAELSPVERVSVRFDVPNDFVVEDSSTDLRQSLTRPEVDLSNCYRHVRAYPTSIQLNTAVLERRTKWPN